MALVNVCEAIEGVGLGVMTPMCDGLGVALGFQDWRNRWNKAPSMSTMKRRSPDLPGALVTQEVVPGEDVIDAQALGAGVPLTDVALEQRLVVDERVVAPTVDEKGFGDRLTARLATGRRFHGSLTASGYTLRRPRGRPVEGTQCRKRVSNISRGPGAGGPR